MNAQPTLAEIREWPATISVDDAAKALGIGRSKLYEMIKEGRSPVKVLPFGRRRKVVTADLLRVLSGEDQEAA